MSNVKVTYIWKCDSCTKQAEITADRGTGLSNLQPAGWRGVQFTPAGIPEHDFSKAERFYLCPECVRKIMISDYALRDLQLAWVQEMKEEKTYAEIKEAADAISADADDSSF